MVTSSWFISLHATFSGRLTIISKTSPSSSALRVTSFHLAKTLSAQMQRAKEKPPQKPHVFTPVQHSQSQHKLKLALLPMLPEAIQRVNIDKPWIWKSEGHQPLFLQILHRRHIVLMIGATYQVENLVHNKCVTDHIVEAPQELKMVLSYWWKADLVKCFKIHMLLQVAFLIAGPYRHPE